MIEFDQHSLRDLSAAVSREWLETNGIGGFSSSTIIGLNTRRYHGLLTAATKPPVGRFVLLSKLEETLVIDGQRYELSANQYPGVIHPRGFEYQTGFSLDPFPTFTYEIDGLRLTKTVFMVQGENTTVVRFELHGGERFEITLEVRPLIAFRDYHSTTHENNALNPRVGVEPGLTTLQPYSDLPALHLAHDRAEVESTGFWYRNFQYALEEERGLDFAEDLFNPCMLTFDFSSRTVVNILASTTPHDAGDADAYRAAELARRSTDKTDLVSVLRRAADQFIVAREQGETVIAGYHWFADWGRDTMIALPGLTLVNGRADIAKDILAQFAAHVDQGMLPNRFPDAGEAPEYNTVDATLWFFEAVRSYVQYTGDYEFVRASLYSVLKEIVDWHLRGTRYGIHVDEDGLLSSGAPGVQLTWMDAKVGDHVVTPRHGKPVEIQALWYNALRVMEDLAARFNDAESEQRYNAMADKARVSFNELFWNADAGCLYDVVDGASRDASIASRDAWTETRDVSTEADDAPNATRHASSNATRHASNATRDASIRPNQVIAISLANTMLSNERAASILRVVERELLTPRGLRTVSPSDPNYVGRYEGDPARRDSAYHQGTVWPWLIGPYITAYSRTFGRAAAQDFATTWLNNFQPHLHEACLGQISEIFDGDPPHAPRGCVAQAWSVAELLRAIVEDVEQPQSTLATAG